ncbi:MAG: hypothetical protein E2O69_00265 [Deltaproteobacteria bacterium]|nr:MAG: hypothetical protein E2O69_00265 [Deltaproteobacteria bacterium]
MADERRTGLYLEIFLVSFAVLLLEISLTRIFSFKVSSYYTFLVLGFAMLGIGSGAVFVALWPRLRSVGVERTLPWITLLGAVSIGLGYFVVAGIELSTYESPGSVGQVLRLGLICLVLFTNFVCAGLAIALIFTSRHDVISRLYGADLAGAGAACAVVIPMMWLLTPPGCIMMAGAAFAAAGVRLAWRGQRPMAAVAAAVMLTLAGAGVFADSLPDPVVDSLKSMGTKGMKRWGFETVFSRWHPVFRVDVMRSPVNRNFLWMMHDGQWGSSLWDFDGSEERLAEIFEASNREFPFSVANEQPRVLVIGAAGGHELLAALHFGAESVTGIELNPVTVSLLREQFADFTGHLAEHPKLTLIAAEGRSFLGRDRSKYDIIYFVAPDSYAAMNAAQTSGFVMAESYLYTREMILEAMAHLRPGGILCMQFGEQNYRQKPHRTSRYLATARSAFVELGIEDFSRHVLLATTVEFFSHLATIVLQAAPFSDEQIEAFHAVAHKVPDTQLQHVPGRAAFAHLPIRVIRTPAQQLDAMLDGYAYEIHPVTDDAPFFWHFTRFRDVLFRSNPRGSNSIGWEEGRGEAALLVMLAVSTVFALVFLMLPFVMVRERWARMEYKRASVVYFACLGLGFMFFEICLIQKLTLFLGYPTYTLTVTLFSLLLFSGLGSLASELYIDRRNQALGLLAASLLVLTLFFQFGLDLLVAALMSWSFAARVVVAVAIVAPLGLCLGAFMPLGLGTVARLGALRSESIAWCWAVNGVFSVIASTLAAILSMSYGFRWLLLAALLFYAVAVLALRAIPLRPTITSG